jgi:hypothetical protein
MSEELVNQLTLNFLISKNQLQKLNKKVNENIKNNRKTDKEIYNDRIKNLFNDLLVDQSPNDLLQEVKTGFDFFVDKCIYYFKALDNNELLEKERTSDYPSNTIIHDDIDYEKEERAIERGDYQEKEEDDDDEDEDEEDYDEKEDEDEDEEDYDEKEDEEDYDEKEDDKEYEKEDDDKDDELKVQYVTKVQHPVIVKHKYNKKNNSVGVDDIQKLPLDWFQKVRETYKKNQIIPRKKTN